MTPSRSVRPRTGADLDACVRVIADVQRVDRYPLNWPADPPSWLSPPGLHRAWVAGPGGSVVGHAALGAPAGRLDRPGRPRADVCPPPGPVR